jgi:hypothetical protein
MTRGLGRFLRRNTIALLALFLALGGTSYAAATLISGSQIKPHTIAKNRLTNKAIKQLKGNRGPRGLQGSAGPTGAAGAKGATGIQGPQGPGAQWAVVQPDGTITRQSGGITVAHPQTGGYTVTFSADVSRQLILATSSLSNDGSSRGTIVASSCIDYAAFCTSVGVTNQLNTVAVFTLSTAGAQENHAFSVSAIGPTSTSSAPSHTRAGPLGR